MKLKIILLLTVIVLVSCSGQHKAVDSKMAILNNKEDFSWVVGGDHELWAPDIYEFERLDLVLEKAIHDGEFKFMKVPTLKRLKKSYRQYICYVDDNGDKLVYINSFCEMYSSYIDDKHREFDWKNKILYISDGGPCYWHVTINVTKGSYSHVVTNGYG